MEDRALIYSFYDSTKKVGKNDAPGDRKSYDIIIAGNDAGACQLVVRCASRECTTYSMEIEFGEFLNEKGEVLPSEIFRESYVHCVSDRDYGLFPDALIPVDREKPFTVQPVYDINFPFYIKVKSRKGEKGSYKGEIRAVYNGKYEFTAVVNVNVLDFSLPEEPACKTAVGLGRNDLAAFYKLTDREEITETYKRFYDYLLDKNISAYELPYDILDPRADSYMDNPGVTSFVIPYPEDDGLLIRYYKKVQSKTLWAEKGFFYPVDEPDSEEKQEIYNKCVERLGRLCPGFNMATPTYISEWQGKYATELQKESNIFCGLSSLYDNEKLLPLIMKRRAEGTRLWWYVCCGPMGDYCNVFTHFEGIKARLLFWQQKKLGIEGFLYWSFTYWKDIGGSPWNGAHTTPWTGPDTFGDGSLLYADKNGPVSSLRLEELEEGIADYKLLSMAEKLMGSHYVSDKTEILTKSLRDYTKDDSLLIRVRNEISADIEACLKTEGSDVLYDFTPATKKTVLEGYPLGEKSRNIYLPKNSREGCHLNIRSMLYYGSTKYNIEFSPFVNEEGQVLDTRVYEEKFVKCVSDKSYGTYPEILTELPLGEAVPQMLYFGFSRAFYIEAHADKSTRPGTYRSVIRLVHTDDGKTEFEAEVKATVWDFCLEDTPSCATAFGLSKYNIDRRYFLDPDSVEAKEMYKKYYEYLLSSKISPYALPCDILSDEADKYMSDPRLTSFIIPCPEDDELLKKYYKKVQSNPVWAAKGCFYPIDEPGNEESYTRYKEITDRLQRLCPGYHMVTPFGGLEINMQGKNIPTPVLQEKSDIICPISDNYRDEKFREQVEKRRQKGDRVWWYVCCAPDPYKGFCNFFTHYEGIRHRLLFWQQKKLNINGILYWETAFWSKVDSPWTDQHTSPWTGNYTFGDGNLLYPGADGPVPSLRLKLISSGIDDFAILTMAEKLFGRKYVEEKISLLTESLTEYTFDDELFEKVRKDIGNRIEKAE